MNTFLLLALTGAFAGTLGGLFGIGGGIVIVPALYVVFTAAGAEPDLAMKTAVGTSLATIIVTSLRSVRAHRRRGAVDFGVLVSWAPFIAGGSVLGALAARVVSGDMLLVLFACGVIAIGIQRVRGGAGLPGKMSFSPLVQRLLALGTGFFSALMGIGGGVIGVLLLSASGRTIHQAVGTASGFGMAIAIPGALGFVLVGLGQGSIAGAIGFVHIPAFLSVALGTLIFAPAGASLAHRLSPGRLSTVFGIYLLVTGVLLLREAILAA